MPLANPPSVFTLAPNAWAFANVAVIVLLVVARAVTWTVSRVAPASMRSHSPTKMPDTQDTAVPFDAHVDPLIVCLITTVLAPMVTAAPSVAVPGSDTRPA